MNRAIKPSLLVCLVLSLFAAGAWPAGATTYWGGEASAIKDAYYDGSVASYGWGSIFDSGRSNWGGISSKVSIGKTTSTANYPDKYYVGQTSNANLWGFAPAYKKDANGNIVLADVNYDTWLYCTVSAYENTIKLNQPGGLTTSQTISSVTTHEIGHTLSLGHSPSSETSVMVSAGATNFSPTNYDKTELKSKWGN
ncbi:hypothetical protein D7Z26_13775 [Cohnella endophytica]|uniref:Peptidase M10 metallopeptidase domain-containing protein n=1 Tax=Cohnella endophytica TaxID=2419778 RepID=A0A494Y3D0_9BACL|nr:hypothetical protein [Cohnella endophytica]RKP54416.1 hypothetical protein D7Z26_13775 [Cohnella endophytica]